MNSTTRCERNVPVCNILEEGQVCLHHWQGALSRLVIDGKKVESPFPWCDCDVAGTSKPFNGLVVRMASKLIVPRLDGSLLYGLNSAGERTLAFDATVKQVSGNATLHHGEGLRGSALHLLQDKDPWRRIHCTVPRVKTCVNIPYWWVDSSKAMKIAVTLGLTLTFVMPWTLTKHWPPLRPCVGGRWEQPVSFFESSTPDPVLITSTLKHSLTSV